jgi:lipoprotein-releasing system ATP-binding protein
MEVVLKASAVTRILEGEIPVTLVRDVNLEVRSGEFVAITGPSGSGKSSLLYLLGLLDRPTAGAVSINGTDTSEFGEDELADARLSQMGFVFQSHFLLPEFSATENVMLPMQRLGGISQKEIEAHAATLLDNLGLAGQAHKLPSQMSGGQSQRVAIARALANDPVLILADEPTGNLDTAASANVQTILRDLARKHDRSVVVVTHDRDFAKSADRVIVVVDGKIEAG